MTAPSSSRTKWLAGAGLVTGIAAIAVLFVLPAEFGIDPTGAGEAMGLTKIADPDNPELERGMTRMETQEVLTTSETALPPEAGITDSWEYELAPFESVEFKYTIAEGQPVVFHWEGTAPLAYDMHAHPFEGGEELTESYAVGDAQAMTGRYTPAFTGIHGWFWENRTMDNVILRLEASGGMTHSTIFAGGGASERPLEGAQEAPEGTVAGHEMQNAE